MKAKVTSALFLVCAALSTAWLLRSFPPDERPTILAAGVLALTVASAGVFFGPRFSYCLGALSGLVILYWFSRSEFYNFPAINTWIAFDLPDSVIDYLLRHLSRDLPSLMSVLDALDRHSLEAKRPITLPLLKELLRPEDDGPA